MESNLVNRDEALRAIDIGKIALSKKEFEKALRFFKKSCQLYDSKEARNLIKAAENMLNQSQKNVNNRSASMPGKSSNTDASKSSASDDHVKRIHSCKSFYDVLGVPKSASSKDLKKAYNKEVLKVHPDKNKSDGAEGAFQKVTEAYETLSDDRKREIYDQVGHDRYKDRTQRGGDAGAQESVRTDVTPEELFEMFFNTGGGGGGGGVRFNHFRPRAQRRQMTPQERQEAEKARRRQQLFTILPILFLVIVWFAGAVFGENPAYSLQRSYTHPVKRTTGRNFAMDYFVEKTFDKRFPKPQDVQRVEQDVKLDWLKYFEQHCIQEQRQREQQLYWASTERAKKLRNIPLVYCEKYEKIAREMER